MSDDETREPDEAVGDDAEVEDDEEVAFEQVVGEAGQDPRLFRGYSKLKQRAFRITYHPATEVAIFVFIVASVGLLVYEVAKNPTGATQELLNNLELGLTSFFLVEYLVKLWLAPRKLRWMARNWIDLLALIPLLRVFRLARGLRLLRLFRLLRLIRVGSLLQARLAALGEAVEHRLIENVIVVGFMVFAVVFGTVGIMIFERNNNEAFQTIGDALWWCVVTITTVGYGDKFPVTTGGKVVAGVIMFIGLSFYALLTGLVTTLLIDRIRREEGKGMDIAGIRDHIVVCGWNAHGQTVVEELLGDDIYAHVVVVADLERLPVSEANVHLVQGDFTEKANLEKARAQRAKAAVVLADRSGDRSEQDADARAILAVLAIESMNSDVHTAAEVLNADNEFHFRNAGVDEIIISGRYTGNLLAHATIDRGLGDVYHDLLTMEGDRLHVVPAPKEHVGSSFMKALATLQESTKALPIGILRGGKVKLNPGTDRLRAGDRLVLIAATRPKLQ